MSTPGIEAISDCPYCEHKNKRFVRAAIGSKQADHFCEKCGAQYWEHYSVSVVLNSYPIPPQYRKTKVEVIQENGVTAIVGDEGPDMYMPDSVFDELMQHPKLKEMHEARRAAVVGEAVSTACWTAATEVLKDGR